MIQSALGQHNTASVPGSYLARRRWFCRYQASPYAPMMRRRGSSIFAGQHDATGRAPQVSVTLSRNCRPGVALSRGSVTLLPGNRWSGRKCRSGPR